MMTEKRRTFHAKILLFGEYAVLCDSMALTVPYERYSGQLDFITGVSRGSDKRAARQSNKTLKNFLEYLEVLSKNGKMPASFDPDAMRNDIREGLFFRSTIPQGYGVGSSGALCAAVYDRYVLDKITVDKWSPREFRNMKTLFGRLESLFHGVSSGLDPLNSYVNRPLLVKPGQTITTVKLPQVFSENGGVFLINTGRPGKTGPLVKHFFERCKNKDFSDQIKNEMIPLTDNCIDAFIRGHRDEFFQYLRLLSVFLLEYFRPMIPDTFEAVWQAGLDSGAYYLKLNGSGGGGFLLGFTPDYDETRRLLAGLRLEMIPVSVSTFG